VIAIAIAAVKTVIVTVLVKSSSTPPEHGRLFEADGHLCYKYCMEITIKYSPELELKRLNYTIKNGYDEGNLLFPKNVNHKSKKNLSDDKLLQEITNEYDDDRYNLCAQYIENNFKQYDHKITSFIANLKLPIINEITVYLTVYGTGGSYHLPNQITVNIARYFNIGLFRNILHEIIHLHIEHLIQKYNIGQWEKETVVDLLFEKAFSEIYKKMAVPVNTEKVIDNFNRYYPDLEKILFSIAK